MAGGEHFAGRGLAQQPLVRLVAGAPRVGDEPDPVVVHVEAQRRRRRVLRQPPRLARGVGERQAEAAEFLREGHLQIARRLQLVEIFLTELIVAVVLRRALATPVEQRVGDNGPESNGHESPPLGD